jgi:ATP-dependent DNA helicase RecG
MLLTPRPSNRPHLLVMTATPDPAHPTLTHYGEMDVSRLDEMPPGRQPIETRVLSAERLPEVIDALGRHIAQDKQAYWVCPFGRGERGQRPRRGRGARPAASPSLRRQVGLIHGG